MPILFMAVVALLIFLVLGGMFFAAMEAEHKKRQENLDPESQANAKAAGR